MKSIRYIILFFLLTGLTTQGLLAAETADDWYEAGNILFQESKYPEALEAYNKALDTNQHLTAAWIAKGITLQKLGRYDLALSSLNTSIETDPENSEAWFTLGSLFFDIGQYPQAEDAFLHATAIRPTHSEAWNYLGNALFMQGLFAEAAEAYQKTLEVDPKHKNAGEGVNMTRQAVQYPGKGWKYIGDYLYGEGKFTEAINAYHQSLLIDPTYTEVQTNLNTTMNALMDPEKAMLGPAIFSLMFGDYESALKGYEKVTHLYPNSSDAWSGMGLVLQKMKRYDAAEHAYQEALKHKPDDEKIWKNFGDLLITAGKPNDARNAYEQALTLNPAYTEVRDLLESSFNTTTSSF